MVSVIPAFILAHAHLLLLQLRHHGLEATPETILRAAQKASTKWDVVRDSHLVLICAGQGGAAAKATEMGLTAWTLEIVDEADQDITQMAGLLYAAWITMKLVVGGLCWSSPICTTWVSFMSRNTWGRGSSGAAVLGDTSMQEVRSANTMALFMSP